MNDVGDLEKARGISKRYQMLIGNMRPINIRSVGARGIMGDFPNCGSELSKTIAQKSHDLGETRNDAEGN